MQLQKIRAMQLNGIKIMHSFLVVISIKLALALPILDRRYHSLHSCNVRARPIIESSCLTIRQAIRAKLYDKCLLFVLKKSLSPISSHNTGYLGLLIPMFSCPAWCLYGSQTLISLLYISISLAISPLLYLL
jgi:hypothetical protein